MGDLYILGASSKQARFKRLIRMHADSTDPMERWLERALSTKLRYVCSTCETLSEEVRAGGCVAHVELIRTYAF